MDAAVRHLRDGALPEALACATICILDDLQTCGGLEVLQQAFLEVANAVKLRRSQATSIRLVSLTGELMEAAQHANAAAAAAIGPATAFHRPVSSGHGQQDGPLVSVVDLHSDPWGWRAASSPSTSGPSPGAGPCNAIDPHASTGTPGLAGQPPGVQLLTSLEEMKAAILQQPGEGLRGLAAGTGAGPAAAAAAAAGGGKPAGVGGGVAGAGGGAGAAGGGGGDGGAGGGEAGQRRRLGVVVDCLSTLMQRYGEWQVLSLLEALQRHPDVSCILTALHTDLHSEQVVSCVRRVASCCLELSGLTPLQQQLAQQAAGQGRAVIGRVDCRTKRRAGRVKVESEVVALRLEPQHQPEASSSTSSFTGGPGGSGPGQGAAAPRARDRGVPLGPLDFLPLPPNFDALDPKALLRLMPAAGTGAGAGAGSRVGDAGVGAGRGTGGAGAGAPEGAAGAGAGAAAGGGGGAVGHLGGVATPEELARAVGSSMRLTLTEEERRAREQVVLPYQHAGDRGALAAAYSAGDHRAYLPPAAGGVGPAAGGGGGGAGGGGTRGSLGHILYVRDSEGEADSDEDLDQDLDI